MEFPTRRGVLRALDRVSFSIDSGEILGVVGESGAGKSLTGVAIVYARLSLVWSPATLNRIGRVLLGICAASFTVEQAIYLHATAHLVPKWIPPSQMFWAVATTVSFALAAVALLINRMALLASRLLTMMIVSFGLLVWVPLVISDPHSHTNWSENAETFAIAGATWILADLLGESRLNDQRPR